MPEHLFDHDLGIFGSTDEAVLQPAVAVVEEADVTAFRIGGPARHDSNALGKPGGSIDAMEIRVFRRDQFGARCEDDLTNVVGQRLEGDESVDPPARAAP
ncbi:MULTISPECIES: hypothetical protein [unclassified Streptomyces]|uniref:hypothetical protein n=1 Tax=unclassified Streptomyces TaxID=2593676 RepID=UPI002E818014|nr:hypothetical protein [Streptomyces sp. NBC_00589]